jgi:quercetin dioxygenase-like cupin family protein
MKIIKRDDRHVFTDDRGLIDVLLDQGVSIKNVLYMTGRAGAVRGSHVHKKDTHYCMVLTGMVEYCVLNEDKSITKTMLNEGDIVFTPVGEIHKFVFATTGTMLALCTESRAQNDYEEDITRIEF